METNFFFGNNTADGFIGANDHILSSDKLIILKGGAGTGKSTIIKKIAVGAQQSGLDAELYHCSSDADSLDAVYVPSLSAAVVDGTAPHVVEAVYPALKHFVLNLTDKTDFRTLLPHSLTIENCVKNKKVYFNNAYCHLKCAYTLKNNINNFLESYIDNITFNRICDSLLNRVSNNSEKINTKKIASALTNKGVISYLCDDFEKMDIIALTGDYDFVKYKILSELKERLDIHKISYTCFPSPFDAGLPEALKIGTTLFSASAATMPNAEKIDCNTALKALNRRIFDSDNLLIEKHVDEAVANLNYAHVTHVELEKIYYNAMDWEDINEKTEKIFDVVFN